jgi:hypothetical protein
MTSTITIKPEAAGLAEDKDYAREIRLSEILPALDRGEHVVLDFAAVSFATQSFVHALVGEALKRHGETALELLEFKNCSKQLRDIIEIVVDYSLGGFDQKAVGQ